jgi:DNA-binding NarL/FixJ family response regulator
MNQLRVLLVDDHTLVRRGFRRLLEDDTSIAVIGEAADSAEALELTRRHAPDVVVLDYALPGENGALTTRKLLALQPDLKVLILSMHSEPAYVRQAQEAGACGYLLKNALDLELVTAIKQLEPGGWLADPRLVTAPPAPGKRPLSTRELEVLHLIVAGQSNKEIAHELGLSANTIAVHRANIMDALGIHNTAELVVHAIRHGLVSLS